MVFYLVINTAALIAKAKAALATSREVSTLQNVSLF